MPCQCQNRKPVVTIAALNPSNTISTIFSTTVGTGTHTLTASYAGDTAAPQFAASIGTDAVTVTPAVANQTITFAQPAPAAYGATFNVNPIASSGLAVTVTATGGCTVESATPAAGWTVTMTSGSTDCVLTASQAGNASFFPAPNVMRTVTALKVSPTVVITWVAFSEINQHNHNLWNSDRFPFRYLNKASVMHHNHHATFTGGNYATITLLYDWMFGTHDYGKAARKAAKAEAKARVDA